MKYKTLPLMYMTNEHFKNTLRFAIEMKDPVDPDALRYAVDQVQVRYPYFSVQVITEEEEYVLTENPRPFVISAGGKPLCLNSAETNGHLMSFAFRDHTIFTDITHAVCDGNGFLPVAKTLAYYYIERRYGAEGIDTGTINLVSDPVLEEEYRNPFPDHPFPVEDAAGQTPPVHDPFQFDDAFFDAGGSYAYNLLVRQQDLMKCAKACKGSPVSFISALLYRCVTELFPETEKEVVFLIPHQYRQVLGCPLSHESLARVFTVFLDSGMRNESLETLNTVLRDQIRSACDPAADKAAVNGALKLHAHLKTLSLEKKKEIMPSLAAAAMQKNTFGVSYTGNIPWGGMEKYIRDAHGYAGETGHSGSVSLEVFTIGDYFSLCIMQPGKNPALVQKLMEKLAENGIECRIASEERYEMPDYEIV